MSRKNSKRTKQNASRGGGTSQSTVKQKPWDELSFWQRRKEVSTAKEFVSEINKIKKRFGHRSEAQLATLKFRFYKLLPLIGPGTRPLLSESLTAELGNSMEEYKNIRSKKGDIRPVSNTMVEQLRGPLKEYRRSKTWGYISSFLIAASVALFLRAFAFEPFRIPSGSMIPTLQVGDYIYVNKFVYGLRIPFTQHPPKHFVTWSLPERGDIVVFIEPLKNSEDWIKRVVALPGDHVRFDYSTNQLSLKRGGKGAWSPVKRTRLKKPCSYMDKNEKLGEDWHPGKPCVTYEEQLDGKKYHIIYDKVQRGAPLGFPTSWVVPEGCVFVMGDNRDNSEDSRFLVKDGKPNPCIPINNIKGRAEFIWLSRGPEGMRWSRIFDGIH